MIYGKLPIIILSVINSEKKGSTNSTIAEYLLGHIEEVKGLGIKELAEKCFVGTGSISRFCHDIGLENYQELKTLIEDTILENEENYSGDEYLCEVSQSIEQVANSIDASKLDKLCKDIKNADSIAAFGLLKAQSAALCFQTDMLMQGRAVYSNINFSEQTAYIENAGKNDLIIIFSYTGTYFDSYRSKLILDKAKCPKIWMVCGEKDDGKSGGMQCQKHDSFIYDTLTFKSEGKRSGHPYQLEIAEGIIVNRYRQLFEAEY